MKSLLASLTLAAPLSLVSQLVFADINQIDNAANAMDVKTLTELTQTTQDYERAYANYRLAISANILGQKTVATNALDQAQQTLETLSQSQANADNYALLAAVYGMKIAFDSSLGMSLGMKSSKLLSDAEKMDNQNPRVKLVQAISAYHTPAVYGGGMEKTESFANQAIALYNQPCDHICWGHAEAYTWRGLAKQDQGNMIDAKQDWQQALTVNPQYGWAKFLLTQNAAQ